MLFASTGRIIPAPRSSCSLTLSRRYLSKRLAADGIASLLLTGDSEGDKQDIIAAFAASKEHTILLSSEVGSKDLDPQFGSSLVNYDLPWNPMVVAQRIGRIHRIEQKSQRILLLNLVFKDTVDERILDRLYRRMDLFQTTIGNLKVILGEQINRLSMDLLTLRLTPKEEEERIDTQVAAIENLRIEEEALEASAWPTPIVAGTESRARIWRRTSSVSSECL